MPLTVNKIRATGRQRWSRKIKCCGCYFVCSRSLVCVSNDITSRINIVIGNGITVRNSFCVEYLVVMSSCRNRGSGSGFIRLCIPSVRALICYFVTCRSGNLWQRNCCTISVCRRRHTVNCSTVDPFICDREGFIRNLGIIGLIASFGGSDLCYRSTGTGDICMPLTVNHRIFSRIRIYHSTQSSARIKDVCFWSDRVVCTTDSFAVRQNPLVSDVITLIRDLSIINLIAGFGGSDLCYRSAGTGDIGMPLTVNHRILS